ncbi:MAG: hypothetical protein IKA56_02985 [Clostridia bacterium]|nr:hypothetical protein [Clostridia bacterium]
MNKTLKKTLSIVLSILMVVTSVPFAFAAEGDEASFTPVGGEAVSFATVEEAIAEAQKAENEGGVVTLLKDIELGGYMVNDYIYILGGKFTLDLNGKSITSPCMAISIDEAEVDLIDEAGTSVIDGGGESNAVVISDSVVNIYGGTYKGLNAISITGNSEVVVDGESVRMENYNPNDYSGSSAIHVSEGIFTLKNGIVSTADEKLFLAYDGSVTNIEGGTVCSGVITAYGGEFTVSGGNFDYGVTIGNETIYKSFSEILADGYVFFNESGKFVYSEVSSLSEACIVTAHTHSLTEGKCVCGYECPHESFTDGKCLDCGVEGKVAIITMADEYSDSWNGAAIVIELLADGETKEIATVTLDSEKETDTFFAFIKDDGIYIFKWTQGGYDEECSFTIDVDGETVYRCEDGSTLTDGKVFYATCEHSLENGICTLCGLECGVDFKHDCSNGDGICVLCGYKCTHESYTDGICNVCGYECPHEGGTQTCMGYKCSVCGSWYGEKGDHVDYREQTCKGYYCNDCNEWFGEADLTKHYWLYGRCAFCNEDMPEDYVCEPHHWNQGTCNVCGLECSHEEVVDGVCTNCNYLTPFRLEANDINRYYNNFADAYSAAEDGSVISLMTDYEDYHSETIDKEITLDLNGHKWEQPSSGQWYIHADATFTDSVGGGFFGYSLYIYTECTITGGSYRYIDYAGGRLGDLIGPCYDYYDYYSGELLELDDSDHSGGSVTIKGEHTQGVQDCGGFVCSVCNEHFGQGVGEHSYDSVLTCLGYKCSVCGQYSGADESGAHTGGTQTCMGYKCELCNSWYGEPLENAHSNENGDNFCDICKAFNGEEIKVGNTYIIDREKQMKFVPAVDGVFVIRSESNVDPRARLLDSELNLLHEADDSSYREDNDCDFYLEYEYKAGETYYFEFYDYFSEYNYPVIFECNEHQGGKATCIEKAVCSACGEEYGEVDADGHDWSNKDGICANCCGETCPHSSYTDGVCDNCEYACPHEETYKDIVRPVQNADGTWGKGKIVEICYTCGYSSLVKEIERDHEGYAAFDAAVAELEALLNSGEVIDGPKNGYMNTLNNLKSTAYSTVYTEIESAVRSMTGTLEGIIATVEAGVADGTMKKADFSYMASLLDEVKALIDNNPGNIVPSQSGYYYGPNGFYSSCVNNPNYTQASYDSAIKSYDYENQLKALIAGLKDGTMLKADYTVIDEAIAEIEEKLASENVTDEGKAGLEEIKKQLEEMKADENTSAADVAELEKALEDYEEELDKGIEDGTLVKVDGIAILIEYNNECAESLIEKYGEENYNNLMNSTTDEVVAEAMAIEKEAMALTGTVAENAEKIAELKERLKALFDAAELCLAGTHSFMNYTETSSAKCEVNAKETGACWFCGETDEREVEGTALEHEPNEQMCKGYWCSRCRSFYGEGNPDIHLDGYSSTGKMKDGQCDGCNKQLAFIKSGETYEINSYAHVVEFAPVVDGRYILTVDGPEGTEIDVREVVDGVNKGINCEVISDLVYVVDCTVGKTYRFEASNYYGYNISSMTLECETHKGTVQTCYGYICDACGEYFGEVPGHDIIIDEAVPPTCTQTGLTEGQHCSRCDDMTIIQEKVPATNHKDTLVKVDAKAATCTEAGWEAYEYCTACDYTTYEEIPALKHSFTKYEVTEEAECGKAGKEVAYCDHGCGATDENEIPALKHSFVNYVYNNDATCEADGTKTAKCANGCGATNKIKAEGTKLDHVDGDGDYICDYGCGHIFEQPDTPDDPADDTCHMCGGKVHGNDIMSRISCFFAMIIRFVTEVLNISKK